MAGTGGAAVRRENVPFVGVLGALAKPEKPFCRGGGWDGVGAGVALDPSLRKNLDVLRMVFEKDDFWSSSAFKPAEPGRTLREEPSSSSSSRVASSALLALPLRPEGL